MKKRVILLASAAFLLAACGEGTVTSSAKANPSSTPEAEVSSSTPSHGNSSTEVTPSSSKEPLQPLAGTDVFYFSGIKAGGETDSAAAKDGMIQYWSGDGGTIYSVTKKNEKSCAVEYTNVEPDATPGWGWYGCQIFYTLPYAEAGDTYTFRANIKTDAAGDITINGEVVSLIRGENVVTKTWTRGAEGGAGVATLAIQLGKSQNGYSTLAGELITFSDIEIHHEAGTYFETKFLNGETLLKDIQVRSGYKVTAPDVTIPQGKLLDGWYDGTAKFDSNVAVTAAHNYSVKFVDASAVTTHTVTFKKGNEVLGRETVIAGEPADTTKIAAPWGNSIVGWYTDETLATSYEGGAINGDVTLYAKTQVNPVTWINSAEANFTFHDEVSHDESGAFVLQFNGWGSSDAWHVQINFAPVPAGEANKNYVINFSYMINVAGGHYQIYDGGSIGAGDLEVASEYANKSISFAGATLQDGAKLTFELGTIERDAEVVFKIGSISLAEAIA
ncbi:MAG: InlB B-repeat-containing protein [Bacilli bacterium]|nr:InlB B-repeat-containing protein [Bacilli bacterium]